jgi:FkbM family methyltransferase
MYTINRGLKEWKLDINTFVSEFYNKCKIFDIIPTNVKFYSQQDEDKYIIQYLLKDKITDGTFLEIGACDGVLYSNSKTLEDYFNFTGILIEPQPLFYSQLVINRKNCKCYNYAVSNSDDEFIEFIGNNAEGGIVNNTNTDISKYTNWTPYKVKNSKMKDIITKSEFKYIDFMIIDVEGSELELLHSIDFKFPIFCIIIEAHSNEQDKNKIFGEYLKSNGFTYIERQRGNEVWINKKYFRKHLFNV